MAEQLVFDLPVREARGRENFFVSPSNAAALEAIEAWKGWPGGKMILVGPPGSGKTHLAHVWAALSGATLRDTARIAGEDPSRLAEHGPLVLEDAEAGGVPEQALFHLHNLLAEAGHALLITATSPPRDWDLTLPDLRSRMDAAPVARLNAPDDPLLKAVLLKQFSDRQISVSPRAIDWLIARLERSFDAVKDAVERLDRASLSENRAVTWKLAARVLDIGPPDDA